MTEANTKELLRQAYNKGYSQGYRNGYNDAATDISQGITRAYAPDDTLSLPIQDLNLSTRALNCLIGAGCKYIRDVVNLNDHQILYMRRLGKVSGNEIAKALKDHNIENTAWTQYLF